MNPSTPYVAAFGAAGTLGMLLLHLVFKRIVTPRHTVRGDLRGANTAWRLTQVGEVFAVFWIAASVVQNCLTGVLGHDLVWVSAFGALGVLLLEGVSLLGKRLLLRAKLRAELDRDNAAAGLAAAASSVSAGILLGPALAGNDLRSVGLAMTFFTLAVFAQAGFVSLFRALTSYDDEEQIRGENFAAALSYAGLSIAVSVMVARGVEGDFEGWSQSLRGFGKVVAWTLGLYPVRQIVVQGLLLGARPSLRGGALDEAIGADHNNAMAALEAAVYLGTATLISTLA
ncbi:MAG: DUF350 domain-containing protein [Myxococcales bacterium]|nr:DUF350 domain-containing protein [Myxococcales bacterium]